MRKALVIGTLIFTCSCMLQGQQTPESNQPRPLSEQMARFGESLKGFIPPTPIIMPLYQTEIPNSIPTQDEEKSDEFYGLKRITAVSRPSMTVCLPPKKKATGAAILIFPGGAYTSLSWGLEGTTMADFFVSHGVAGIIVKYRMPSENTMQNKSIGPLQDAQQALRLVRQHAKEWGIDPEKVGVIGFSAGGHLAATVGTHFAKSYVPNEDRVNVRPDFMVLVYPAISLKTSLVADDFREVLLGKAPSAEQITLFSNEEQVTQETPRTLILHASNDGLVDVTHSLLFYQSLHRNRVPVEMVLLSKGNHGFFEIARDEWQQPLLHWLVKNGWGTL